MPIFADYVNDIIPSTAIPNTTASTTELNLGNLKLKQWLYVTISGASSLVGGAFYVQAQVSSSANNTTGTWVKFPAEYAMLTTDSGSPAAVAGNSASATMTVGGVCMNTTGVTNITDNGTYLIGISFSASPLRIAYLSTSGTGNISATTFGFTVVGG